MAKSAFDVDFKEVRDVQINYGNYYSSLSEGGALCTVDDACVRLSALDSFSGESAESIKSYFRDVHGSLLEMVYMLSNQLLTDYNGKFWPQFTDGEIKEDREDARWVESKMTDAANIAYDLIAEDLYEAARLVRFASYSLPDGVSFPIPREDQVESDLLHEKKETERIRDAVESADDFGAQLFNSKEGEFASLAVAISSAIKGGRELGGSNITSYQSGSFSQVKEVSGLTAASSVCKKNQQKYADVVTSSRKEGIKFEKDAIEKARKKALEKKRFWDAVGTVASTVAFVAGGLALVSTAGAAAPLVIGLRGAMLVQAGSEVIERAKGWVDPTFERNSSDVQRSLKTASKILIPALELEHHFKEGGDSLNKDLLDDGIDLLEIGTDQWIDAGFAYVKDECGLGKVESAYADGFGTVVKEVKNAAFDGKSVTPLNVVNVSSEIVTGVADAHSSEALEEVKKCESREAALDEAEEKIGLDHTWSSERS